MGMAYRAVDTPRRRRVVLKVIRPVLASDPAYRERFAQEARHAGRIRHDNIAAVYRAGEDRDVPYIVMQYIEGRDLRTVLDRDGPLAPQSAAELVAQVGDALSAVHEAGLVHLDVKPANILLDVTHENRGRAFLVDFGIAQPIRRGTDRAICGRWLGTPAYAAPEQLTGAEVGGAADTYALGCVLFELLTGTPAYPGSDASAVARAHLKLPVPAPSALCPQLPRELDDVIAGALAKHPSDRFASPRSLGAAAGAATRIPDSSPTVVWPPARTARRAKRGRALSGAHRVGTA